MPAPRHDGGPPKAAADSTRPDCSGLLTMVRRPGHCDQGRDGLTAQRDGSSVEEALQQAIEAGIPPPGTPLLSKLAGQGRVHAARQVARFVRVLIFRDSYVNLHSPLLGASTASFYAGLRSCVVTSL